MKRKLNGFGDPIGVGDYVRIDYVETRGQRVVRRIPERGTYRVKEVGFRKDRPEVGFHQSNRGGMWCWYKGVGKGQQNWRREFKLATPRQVAQFERTWKRNKGRRGACDGPNCQL